MRSQTVILAAVAALACLGVSQAIKCYSCIYNSEGDSSVPGNPASNSKCADSFDTSLTSLTGIDQTFTDWDDKYGFVFDPEDLKLNLTNARDNNKFQKVASLFNVEAPKSAGVNAGPFKVHCFKQKLTFPNGEIQIDRGFTAGAAVSNACLEGSLGGVSASLCACDSDECNSASGLQLSFGLIAAVVFIGKFVC